MPYWLSHLQSVLAMVGSLELYFHANKRLPTRLQALLLDLRGLGCLHFRLWRFELLLGFGVWGFCGVGGAELF